ncbi:MAG: tetratricopeptide repeat protein [candidate division WOR-3 bacterium]|uniref:Tetratricopeptide repeat protein n=1 Tax=candidate division WOR-3 bacterium TaxID=2052148 RepID=A0A7C1T121_UNCW3|nr:tetratricopeptide repeat protein [candidate division WOR-3 bacterium]
MKRRLGLLLLIFPVSVLTAADARSLVRRGNSFYHRQRFEEALSFYQQAEVLEPDNLGIHYNLGNTYYRLNRHSEAVSELSLATVSRNPRARAQAFYNLGNTLYRLGRLDEALNAYRLALLANPRDRQAKENFEFCLRQQQRHQSDSTAQQQSGQSQQQQQSGQNQPDRQQSQPRSQTGGQMDREQAERVLQAVQQKEREAQKQARRAKTHRQVEKDW